MNLFLKQVQDSSIAGSSDDEDLLGVIRGPSTFANAFLYIGNKWKHATLMKSY